MKKRIVKKWVKRYITPLVDHLPRTGPNHQPSHYESYKLINGDIIPEACMYEVDYTPKSAVRKQIKGIRDLLKNHEGHNVLIRNEPQAIIASNQIWHVGPEHQRKNPKMKFYGIAVRLFVERRSVSDES